MEYAVKAVGDYKLHIRAIPFDVVDSDRQYFDSQTDYMLEKIPAPLVADYHGIGQGKPNIPGKAERVWTEPDGVWTEVSLDKGNTKAEGYWQAAQAGKLAASSGTIAHLARLEVGGKLIPYDKRVSGRIAVWPFAELSLINTEKGEQPANKRAVAYPALKSVYEQAGIELPELQDEPNEPQAATAAESEVVKSTNQTGVSKMNDEKKEVVGLTADEIKAQITAAIKAEGERVAAEAAAKKADEERIAAEVAKQVEAYKAQEAAGRRLPEFGKAPYVAKYGETRKYDNLDAGDTALLIEVMGAAKKANQSDGPSIGALKSLAFKLEEAKDETYAVAQSAMKAAGVKANELNHSTQAGYGDEWVGVAYSTRMWESIRQNTFVMNRLMANAIEVPQGMESMYLPLESSDLTFYKVAQATATNATTGIPDATVSTSKIGTDRASLSLVKMGARGVWSAEMEEDSLIPFIPNLRRQLELGYAEQFEHVLIDGDTATGATTNINDIAGTPAGTEAFLLVNGFRKSPLVTTTANSRSAAGAFGVNDFTETLKLMGLAGRNAQNKNAVEFIIDLWTAWKALQLPEVKTRDVFASPTIENGELTSIFGYKVNKSAFMHYANQDATYGLKANTAGKLDLDTASNNTTGAILAVRFDQWQLGIRRRLSLEVQRIPQADASQIVAFARFGLTQRDTEASAITYNVGL